MHGIKCCKHLNNSPRRTLTRSNAKSIDEMQFACIATEPVDRRMQGHSLVPKQATKLRESQESLNACVITFESHQL